MLYTLVAHQPSRHERYHGDCSVHSEELIVESGLDLPTLERRIAELGTQEPPYETFHAFPDTSEELKDRVEEVLQLRVRPVLAKRKEDQGARWAVETQEWKARMLQELKVELARYKK